MRNKYFFREAIKITFRVTKSPKGYPAVKFTITDCCGKQHTRNHSVNNVKAMYEKAGRLVATPRDSRHVAAIETKEVLRRALKSLEKKSDKLAL